MPPPSKMDTLADLADKYSFGEIRVGHEQNLALPHVARRRPAGFVEGARQGRAGDAERQPGVRHHRLPGAGLLSLANARSIPIAQELTRRFANHDTANLIGRLHINISGCINACGHHHVGHIGILASRRTARRSIRSRSAAAPTRMPSSAT